MALTQTELEDKRDALDRAIYSNVLTATTSDGKSVTYRSEAALYAARRAVGAALGEGRKTRVSYVRIRDEGC